MCGMKQKRTVASGVARGLFLVALCASGVVGCSREEAQEEAPPPYVPESYMKDPEFRGKLAAQRQARNKIVNERAAVKEKMQEIARRLEGDEAKIVKDEEWLRLKAQLEDLNARYEQARQEQLQYVRDRITPQKK